jgi:acetyl esterase/lipase
MAEDESILNRGARAADAVVAYGTEPHQIIEVRDGGGSAAGRPLLVIIHGGFWRPDIDRSHARPMADALADAGWTAALPEYARVPGNPGATLADVTAILARAGRETSNHDGRMVLIGHSAGGHLVLWATAKQVWPALCGTLALAPAADLRLARDLGLGHGAVARFLGAEPESRTDVDPRRMPGPLTATTLVHGTEDGIVPLRVSESYADAHPRARLVPLHGAGHFALIDPLAPAWSTVMAELSRFVA